jgi:hypothetical protein
MYREALRDAMDSSAARVTAAQYTGMMGISTHPEYMERVRMAHVCSW